MEEFVFTSTDEFSEKGLPDDLVNELAFKSCWKI